MSARCPCRYRANAENISQSRLFRGMLSFPGARRASESCDRRPAAGPLSYVFQVCVRETGASATAHTVVAGEGGDLRSLPEVGWEIKWP